MKRFTVLMAAAIAAFGLATAVAQEKKTRISIGTGGTAGVYYPLGGGLAATLSKFVPGLDATAEVAAGSIANLQLIGGGKSELGFTMADSAWDAYNGLDRFQGRKVGVKTLVVFYPNRMQVATLDGKGIEKMTDLKGKRVATGAPASGTEVMSMRLLEAFSQVGRYGVKVEVIDQLGAGAFRSALDHIPIVIIDEIGKMEVFSSQFQSAVLKAVSGSKIVLATAMLSDHAWLAALQALPDVEVWEVTKPNRTRLIEQVLRWVQAQA